MNRDFAEILSALSDPGAEFVIVGAHALAAQLGGFDEAWSRRQWFVVDEQRLPFLCREDLARNKRAAGRPKDLADLAALEGKEP